MNNADYEYLEEMCRREEMLVRYELPLDLAHFINLHAHNHERFGDEFRSLSYNSLVKGTLNKMRRRWVELVVEDLKECLDKEATRLLELSILQDEDVEVPVEERKNFEIGG